MSRRADTAAVVAAAVALGLAAGWLAARRFDAFHRRDLFSSRVYRRRAALGWLLREKNPERLPLLRDYLDWELVPALRLRAWKLVGLLRAAGRSPGGAEWGAA